MPCVGDKADGYWISTSHCDRALIRFYGIQCCFHSDLMSGYRQPFVTFPLWPWPKRGASTTQPPLPWSCRYSNHSRWSIHVIKTGIVFWDRTWLLSATQNSSWESLYRKDKLVMLTSVIQTSLRLFIKDIYNWPISFSLDKTTKTSI